VDTIPIGEALIIIISKNLVRIITYIGTNVTDMSFLDHKGCLRGSILFNRTCLKSGRTMKRPGETHTNGCWAEQHDQ